MHSLMHIRAIFFHNCCDQH